jgi:predicted outer membrane protein
MKNIIKTCLYISIITLSVKLEAVKTSEIGQHPEVFPNKFDCKGFEKDIANKNQTITILREKLKAAANPAERKKILDGIHQILEEEANQKKLHEEECKKYENRK